MAKKILRLNEEQFNLLRNAVRENQIKRDKLKSRMVEILSELNSLCRGFIFSDGTSVVSVNFYAFWSFSTGRWNCEDLGYKSGFPTIPQRDKRWPELTVAVPELSALMTEYELNKKAMGEIAHLTIAPQYRKVRGYYEVDSTEWDRLVDSPNTSSGFFWETEESGGGMTNTGYSQVVCLLSGNPAIAYCLGHHANDVHARFRFRSKFRWIEVRVKRYRESVEISGCEMPSGEEIFYATCIEEVPEFLLDATKAAMAKADDYHCRKPYFIF
ncbi:MAG: hypothetical protein V1807_02640 [Patescibacteria group bacterium]